MKNNILLTRVIQSLSENMIIDLTEASSESQLHWFFVDVANRGIYTLQEVCSFRFPVASNSLKDNLKETVGRLSLIEVKNKRKRFHNLYLY